MAKKIVMKLEDAGKDYLLKRKLDADIASSMGVGQSGQYVTFSYELAGVQRIKHRSMEDKTKCFLTGESPEEWAWPFFNQKNFLDKSYIIITEGEFDAVAIATMGYSNVVSIPNGASSTEKAIKNHFKYLQQFDNIYLCLDNDEQGQKAAEKAKTILPKLKWRNILLPCKDANELLQSHFCNSFKTYLENCEKYEVATVLNMDQMVKEAYVKIDAGYSTGWSSLDEKLGGIRLGELTVLTGDTGCGKTSFAIQLMYNLASQHIPVYISSYEVSYVTIMKKLASHVIGKNMTKLDFNESDKVIYERWAKEHNVYLNPTFGSSNIESILQEIEYASCVKGVQVILLDHLHFFLNFDKSENERTAIDFTVRELVKASRQHNVHILLLVHPRQQRDDSGEITMSMLKGSSGIKQDSHNVLGIQRRDRVDPYDPKVIVKVMKNRAFGNEGPVYYCYNKEVGSYDLLLTEKQNYKPYEPQPSQKVVPFEF